MKRKKVIVNKNSKVRRQRDPIPWKYCVLTIMCGLLMVSGFFVAAKQHFSAVGVAMENAELRIKIVKLSDETRRLLLSKQRASSPGRIAKLAKTIGFSAVPRPVILTTATTESASTFVAAETPVFSYASAKADARKASVRLRKSEGKTEKKESVSKYSVEDLKPVIENQVAALGSKEVINSVRE